MKRHIATLLAGLFVLFVLALAVGHNLRKPKVLVLHSYGPEYAWTRDVDVGLRRGFGDQQRFTLRWHYMDLKRHPWPSSRERAGVQARRVIDEWKPDLVVAIDDDAQEYAAKFYANRPGIRIVFAGLNGDIEPYGYDKAANATGILERVPLQAVKDAVQLGVPVAGRAPRVIEISDDSDNVRRDQRSMRSFRWDPVGHCGVRLVGTFEAWQEAVRAAEGCADVILTNNYRQLRRSAADTRLVPPAEVVAWTVAHSRVPVIGLNGFFVEDGGMLAIAKSAFEQGELAARTAVAVLDGKPPSAIPVQVPHQFVVLMRPDLMAQARFRLPDIYEAFARATNGFYPRGK